MLVQSSDGAFPSNRNAVFEERVFCQHLSGCAGNERVWYYHHVDARTGPAEGCAGCLRAASETGTDGDYVIEILAEIEANMPSMDQCVYGAFFRENPVFLKRTHDRMISYWDCYYRWLYKRKLDYVGFRVFEQFREWSASA